MDQGLTLTIDDNADTRFMRYLQLVRLDGQLFAIWQKSADELVAKRVSVIDAANDPV